VRFHIQQEADIPASTQRTTRFLFRIAARHYPPGPPACPAPARLRAAGPACNRNTISKVYANSENDRVCRPWLVSLHLCCATQQEARELKVPPAAQIALRPYIDREVRAVGSTAA